MKMYLSRKRLTKIFPFFTIVLLFQNSVQAQDYKHPLSGSILKQNWAFPFSEISTFSPLYPGLSAGIHRIRTDNLFVFPQSVYLGYYHNHNTGSALYLYMEQGIRFAPKCGFYIEISLGPGYLHAFHAGKIYERKGDVYVKTTDLGKPSFMVSFSQTIGLDLSRKFNIPLAPFIKTQWMVSYPYFDMVIPIKPVSLVHFGTYIYL
jgi:hypothetical protein